MKKELGAWNNGKGIDLDAWVSCSGNFSLAVGYASIFCPKFIEFEGYIIQDNAVSEETIKCIQNFESNEDSSPKSVEWVINHFHIAGLQHGGCEDLTKDKIIVLGETLKEIYEARLSYLFPNKPCIVEFYTPEDSNDLGDYQLSFWQIKHE